MKQEEAVKLAEGLSIGWWLNDENLTAFANLVEKRLCDELAKVCKDIVFFDPPHDNGWLVYQSIIERGNKS